MNRTIAALFCILALVGPWISPTKADIRSIGEDGVSSSPLPGPDGEICQGTTLNSQDDGDFENGYTFESNGVAPPDYGAWAECYDPGFVCAVQFLFTQIGYYTGQSMDVYVWDSAVGGSPPPGPDPGNIICVMSGVQPGDIAFWPDISAHDVQICCDVQGEHFVGYWPDWPDEAHGWFIAADEDGGGGCPRTKFAPEIGYETGWGHPNVAYPWQDCKALGIREYSGIGDCSPTATRLTTWGRIKAMY